MAKFDFFFGLLLGIEILGQTDELVTALQFKNISAYHGKKVFEVTQKTLISLNISEKFDEFWEKTQARQNSVSFRSQNYLS